MKGKMALNDSVIYSLSPSIFFFLHYLCVFSLLFWVNLVLCLAMFCLTCFYLVLFSFLLCFVFHIIKKLKNTKTMYVYIGTCVPWKANETKFSKLCISCSLDEHLYAQLSKWALWLVFVMSKVKWSLVLNTHITLFDGND